MVGLPVPPRWAALRKGDIVTVESTKTLARMASDWTPEVGGPCRVVRVGEGGGDGKSPRLVDRNDLRKGDVVDRRRLGPLLLRTSIELPIIGRELWRPSGAAPGSRPAAAAERDVDRRLCFLSSYGLKAERALLFHCVEPVSRSVSAWAVGERELRALCAVGGGEGGAALLATWLGAPETPATHKRRLSRAQWTVVLVWVSSRLALVEEAAREGASYVLACEDLERAAAAAAAAPPPEAAAAAAPEADDLEDVADLALGAFAVEAYDRICVAAGDTFRAARAGAADTVGDYGLSCYERVRDSTLGGIDDDGALGSPGARDWADRPWSRAERGPLASADVPVVAGCYDDVREAALSALDFDEIRRRKKLPPPNPRPFAQHLVLESKIDAIERDLEARLRAASAAAEVDASGVPVAVA